MDIAEGIPEEKDPEGIAEEKEKESKSIYIAPFILRIVSKRSDMDHTVLLASPS